MDNPFLTIDRLQLELDVRSEAWFQRNRSQLSEIISQCLSEIEAELDIGLQSLEIDYLPVYIANSESLTEFRQRLKLQLYLELKNRMSDYKSEPAIHLSLRSTPSIKALEQLASYLDLSVPSFTDQRHAVSTKDYKQKLLRDIQGRLSDKTELFKNVLSDQDYRALLVSSLPVTDLLNLLRKHYSDTRHYLFYEQWIRRILNGSGSRISRSFQIRLLDHLTRLLIKDIGPNEWITRGIQLWMESSGESFFKLWSWSETQKLIGLTFETTSSAVLQKIFPFTDITPQSAEDSPKKVSDSVIRSNEGTDNIQPLGAEEKYPAGQDDIGKISDDLEEAVNSGSILPRILALLNRYIRRLTQAGWDENELQALWEVISPTDAAEVSYVSDSQDLDLSDLEHIQDLLLQIKRRKVTIASALPVIPRKRTQAWSEALNEAIDQLILSLDDLYLVVYDDFIADQVTQHPILVDLISSWTGSFNNIVEFLNAISQKETQPTTALLYGLGGDLIRMQDNLKSIRDQITKIRAIQPHLTSSKKSEFDTFIQRLTHVQEQLSLFFTAYQGYTQTQNPYAAYFIDQSEQWIPFDTESIARLDGAEGLEDPSLSELLQQTNDEWEQWKKEWIDASDVKEIQSKPSSTLSRTSLASANLIKISLQKLSRSVDTLLGRLAKVTGIDSTEALPPIPEIQSLLLDVFKSIRSHSNIPQDLFDGTKSILFLLERMNHLIQKTLQIITDSPLERHKHPEKQHQLLSLSLIFKQLQLDVDVILRSKQAKEDLLPDSTFKKSIRVFDRYLNALITYLDLVATDVSYLEWRDQDKQVRKTVLGEILSEHAPEDIDYLDRELSRLDQASQPETSSAYLVDYLTESRFPFLLQFLGQGTLEISLTGLADGTFRLQSPDDLVDLLSTLENTPLGTKLRKLLLLPSLSYEMAASVTLRQLIRLRYTPEAPFLDGIEAIVQWLYEYEWVTEVPFLINVKQSLLSHGHVEHRIEIISQIIQNIPGLSSKTLNERRNFLSVLLDQLEWSAKERDQLNEQLSSIDTQQLVEGSISLNRIVRTQSIEDAIFSYLSILIREYPAISIQVAQEHISNTLLPWLLSDLDQAISVARKNFIETDFISDQIDRIRAELRPHLHSSIPYWASLLQYYINYRIFPWWSDIRSSDLLAQVLSDFDSDQLHQLIQHFSIRVEEDKAQNTLFDFLSELTDILFPKPSYYSATTGFSKPSIDDESRGDTPDADSTTIAPEGKMDQTSSAKGQSKEETNRVTSVSGEDDSDDHKETKPTVEQQPQDQEYTEPSSTEYHDSQVAESRKDKSSTPKDGSSEEAGDLDSSSEEKKSTTDTNATRSKTDSNKTSITVDSSESDSKTKKTKDKDVPDSDELDQGASIHISSPSSDERQRASEGMDQDEEDISDDLESSPVGQSRDDEIESNQPESSKQKDAESADTHREAKPEEDQSSSTEVDEGSKSTPIDPARSEEIDDQLHDKDSPKVEMDRTSSAEESTPSGQPVDKDDIDQNIPTSSSKTEKESDSTDQHEEAQEEIKEQQPSETSDEKGENDSSDSDQVEDPKLSEIRNVSKDTFSDYSDHGESRTTTDPLAEPVSQTADYLHSYYEQLAEQVAESSANELTTGEFQLLLVRMLELHGGQQKIQTETKTLLHTSRIEAKHILEEQVSESEELQSHSLLIRELRQHYRLLKNLFSEFGIQSESDPLLYKKLLQRFSDLLLQKSLEKSILDQLTDTSLSALSKAIQSSREVLISQYREALADLKPTLETVRQLIEEDRLSDELGNQELLDRSVLWPITADAHQVASQFKRLLEHIIASSQEPTVNESERKQHHLGHSIYAESLMFNYSWLPPYLAGAMLYLKNNELPLLPPELPSDSALRSLVRKQLNRLGLPVRLTEQLEREYLDLLAKHRGISKKVLKRIFLPDMLEYWKHLQDSNEYSSLVSEQLISKTIHTLSSHPDAVHLVEKAPPKQLDTSSKTSEKNQETEDQEGKIYASKAGLVLIWPFLSAFFKRIGLIEKGEFKSSQDRYRATQLLSEIAWLDADMEDLQWGDDIVERLLCGVSLDDQIPTLSPITQEELDELRAFLDSIKGQWPQMENTTTRGFIDSFLLREGLVWQDDKNWRIAVTRESYDIILTTLPWGLGTIKFPWIDYIIVAEWPFHS